MRHTNITGCILAGGRGLRMGGADKGLIPWQDKPLAGHMLDRLAPQVGPVLIIANRNVDRYQALTAPGVTTTVLPDAAPGYLGPIAGIEAALAACQTPFLVTVPCDTPGFPTDLVTRLHDALAGGQADVAVTHDGEQRQFLFALYRTSVLGSARAALEAGERAVWRWHEKLDVIEVSFANAANQFANFNSKQDVR